MGNIFVNLLNQTNMNFQLACINNPIEKVQADSNIILSLKNNSDDLIWSNLY